MLDLNSGLLNAYAGKNTWLGLEYSNSKWVDWIGRTSNIKSEIGAVETIFEIEHDFNGGHTDDDCLAYRANHDIANLPCTDTGAYACTQNTKSWSQRSSHDAKLLKILGNPGNICDIEKSTCNDNEGSYTCQCKLGYEHAEDSDLGCFLIFYHRPSVLKLQKNFNLIKNI